MLSNIRARSTPHEGSHVLRRPLSPGVGTRFRGLVAVFDFFLLFFLFERQTTCNSRRPESACEHDVGVERRAVAQVSTNDLPTRTQCCCCRRCLLFFVDMVLTPNKRNNIAVCSSSCDVFDVHFRVSRSSLMSVPSEGRDEVHTLAN